MRSFGVKTDKSDKFWFWFSFNLIEEIFRIVFGSMSFKRIFKKNFMRILVFVVQVE